MPSATLLPEDKTTIRMAIGHECQIFTATIAKLYLAYPDPQQWTFVCTGAIAFMKDTKKNDSFFFRFVHLQSGSVVWEQEIYRDFKYFQEKPYFHTFFTDVCTAGFSFADENEALSFYSKVQSRENLRVQPRKPGVANGAVKSVSSQQTSVSSVGVSPASVVTKKGGKKKFDKSAISGPSNFRHLTHVGYDPEKGFSTMNVPPEWKKVFDKAGITEDQLKDAQTAKFIFDFMSQNYDPNSPTPPPGSSSAAVIEDRRPVPNPSAPIAAPSTALPKRGAPPPPPPSRAPNTSTRGPPPVPNRPRPTSEYLPPAPEDLPEPPALPTEPPFLSSPTSSGIPVPPPAPPPAPVFVPSARTSPPTTKQAASKKAPAAVPDVRVDLMASIRTAGVTSLKPALEREITAKEAPAEAPAGDIAGALKAALLKRQEVTRSDDSDDGDQEDDNDEW